MKYYIGTKLEQKATHTAPVAVRQTSAIGKTAF